MIIIDLSHIAVAAAFSSAKTSVTSRLPDDYDKRGLLKHYILNGIRKNVVKFKKEYGEVIIACDPDKSKKLWRKEKFPLYKHARKSVRENSLVDFQMLYSVLDELILELDKEFPYKVIRISGFEADDIIAGLVITALERNHDEKIMIISSDKDFKQLHTTPNVKQMSSVSGEYVVCENADAELIELILHGDTSDGVPNILSPDDVFITPHVRQKRLTSRIKSQMRTFEETKEYCARQNIMEHYERNYSLIALTKETIPEPMWSIVAEVLEQPKKKRSFFDIMKYLGKNNLNKLSEQVGDFI